MFPLNSSLSFRRLAASVVVLAGLSAPLAAQDYVARIGHLESMQQSRHIHLEQVAELVSERTGGAVAFEIFPQGQLGNQREMTEAVQLGTLEATVSPAAFLGGFNPVVSILDIPYLLPADDAKAQALRDGSFGQALLDSFASRGVVGVALWPNGRKNFTSNKPLDSMADFADQKFRVMDSRILIEQFGALGASAVALPFGELYTSLQTGVVDGQENPLDTILRMKFHEVQKHLVVSDHGAMEDVVLFNPTWWNDLPQEHRDVIVAAFAEVIPALTAHKAEAVKAALTEIETSGIDVRKVSEEEAAELRAAMYAPSAAAYVERAGAEGQALLDLYEEQLSAQ
ncbi:MAG: C4-dicarboxylate ABC transporter substrate-binding protein [Pseudooceanicola sp.]|mgnify:CR=1 FL=1|jgi:C4-dicarboxylate-binding protein DctP|nr:C4-dicarboxylate ABC transporter substrate-binding protein [Pseudooceanicola sp.]|tara:strand:+ start:1062 stop:2084 length:1023 start_codon:yes stop_codon:yes gene_type:complete